MSRRMRALGLLFPMMLAFTSAARAQESVDPSALPLDASVPLDPRIVHDTLPNGLVYWIRPNAEPEDRLELRLVLRAGSVLEDDDQRGLAHLVEHMAFNGTEHFEKQELVDALEAMGMRFGPDINATTSFDETVYMLTVPTDSASLLDTAFQVLADWSRGVTFDAEEIEKERPVVVEEWRLGRGARMRTLDEHLPILFHGSRYAERLPIGEKEIIETADVGTVRRFYDQWYRPDLAAVIAVGDLDSAAIEARIRAHFADWRAPAEARPRTSFPVPLHEETLVSVATDPETTVPNVSVYHKRPVASRASVADYRRSIVEDLRDVMLNRRFFEIAQRPDPPFIGAGTGGGSLVETADVYVLGAGLHEAAVIEGLRALVAEAERVDRHGFTPGELERAKAEVLRQVESAYDEREKTRSAAWASRLVERFLHDVPVPSPEAALALHRRFLPEIALDEVGALARESIAERARVVLLTAPEKAGVTVPGEAEVLAAFRSAAESEVAAYVDAAPEGPLVETPPAPGRIVDERAIPEIGVLEWTLSNGATVVLRPTDFKDDEVLFRASSPGGVSLAPDSLIVPAATATWVVEQSGAGDLDLVALEKALAAEQVRVSPFIDSIEEGLSGRASPKDLETLFQLVWLYVTAPRKDPTAFASLRTRLAAQLANRAASPEAASQDSLRVLVSDRHPRVVATLPSPEMVGAMDLDGSFDFYRDRFSDAGDFTFHLVGAFDPDSVRPLVERWLAALPATAREETWRDEGIDPPAGVVERVVRKGIEPKSLASVVFPGPFEWSLEDFTATIALADYLRIRLREEMREDLGGTYGVGVSAWGQRWPDEEFELRISFGADPVRVEELVRVVFREIEQLRAGEVDAEDFAKVKESWRREHETNLRENDYWMGRLTWYRLHGVDPREILKVDERIEALEPAAIVEAARRWIDPRRYVRVTLLPESGAGRSE